MLEYYAFNQEDSNLILVGEPFSSELYGIALDQGSVYTEEINRALLRVVENGTYQTLHTRWFGSEGGL